MPTLIKWRDGRGEAAADAFVDVDDEEAIAPGDVIISLARFQSDGDWLLGQGRRVGVRLQPDEAVEVLAYDLPRIAVVALVFPKFRDGRPFSAARILRERLGYQGEVRAVGDVLLEQAKFMIRCGFDAFEPADGSGPEQWTAAAHRFRHVYQRAADDRVPAFALRGRPARDDGELLERPLSRVRQLDLDLRDAHPAEIIARAEAEFGDRLALVSSFGAESAVLLHLAAQVNPDIAVLFLDTGMLFGQTLDYRRALTARIGLTNVRDLRPRFEDLAITDPHADLWKRDTDACCHIRKVIPLDGALEGFDAWITGRKRFHGGERVRLPVAEEAGGRLKFNPLANWSRLELEAYAEAHDLPAHPLVAQGFPSIGCWPCTDPVDDGAEMRAGRWAGSQKTECGIHTARTPGTVPSVGVDI